MIVLPSLPYATDALEPYISSKTIDYHYGKHHAGYVNKLNKLIEGTEFENCLLMDIVTKSYLKEKNIGIFRNASQTLNHTFYWNSLAPISKVNSFAIDRDFMGKINDSFGSLSALKEKLIKASVDHFSNGWVWLVLNKATKSFEVISTHDAHSPFVMDGYVPLLAVDVWEHAYYLDYQNERLAHVTAIITNILNWEFAGDNFAAFLDLQQS